MRTRITIGCGTSARNVEEVQTEGHTLYECWDRGVLLYRSDHYVSHGIKIVEVTEGGRAPRPPYCGRCFHDIGSSPMIDYVHCGVAVDDMCGCACHDPSIWGGGG